MKLHSRLVVIATLVAASGSCAAPPTGLGAGLSECWFLAEPAWAYANPALDSARVYAAFGGEVIGVDRETGRVAWRSEVAVSGAVGGATLVASHGVVLVPVGKSTIALEAGTGAIRWSYSAPDDDGTGAGSVNSSTPALSHSRAFIPAWGPSVSAIDLVTGSVEWVWLPPDTGATRAGTSGVALQNDTVYVSGWTWLTPEGQSTRQWIVALSAESGAQLWRVDLQEPVINVPVFAPPVVAGSTVALTLNLAGQTFVFDRSTGVGLWSTPSPRGMFSSLNHGPVAAADTLFIPLGDGAVEARRATDEALLWRSTQSYTPVEITLSRRRVYAVAGPTLYVLDRKSGATIWSSSKPSASPLPEPLRTIHGVAADPDAEFLALRVAGGLRCLRMRAGS